MCKVGLYSWIKVCHLSRLADKELRNLKVEFILSYIVLFVAKVFSRLFDELLVIFYKRMSHKRFGQLFKYKDYTQTLEKYSSIIYRAGEAWWVEYADRVNKLLVNSLSHSWNWRDVSSFSTFSCHPSASWFLLFPHMFVYLGGFRGCDYDVSEFDEAALIDLGRCPFFLSPCLCVPPEKCLCWKTIYLFQIEESHLRAKGLSDWLGSSARTSSVWTTVKAKLLYFLILMILANTCNGK